MNSIWDNGSGRKIEDFSGQVSNALGNGGEDNGNTGIYAYRPSRPPHTEDEREVHRIFDKLRGKSCNLIQKRAIAEAVLMGQYGIKHELHAKLLLGPKDLQEVLEDPRDVVPPLLEVISDKDQIVREKIAGILAVRGDARVLFSVYAGMDSDSYAERYEFGLALGKIATNIIDVDALKEMLSEIEKRRVNRGEFSSALRLVKKRLMDLGAVASKPERKKVPFIEIKPSGPKQGEMTIPMGIRGKR